MITIFLLAEQHLWHHHLMCVWNLMQFHSLHLEANDFLILVLIGAVEGVD